MTAIILDESGTWSTKNITQGRFIAFGGIIYDESKLEYLKSIICPEMNKFRNLLHVDELKSTNLQGKNKTKRFVYGGLLSMLNSIPETKTFFFAIDKYKAEFVKKYDKVSFKYNFMLAKLIENLRSESVIDDSPIKIMLDDYKFSEFERENIEKWLIENTENVDIVVQEESKNYDFIQLADIIAGVGKTAREKTILLNKIDGFTHLNIDFFDVFPRYSKKILIQNT